MSKISSLVFITLFCFTSILLCIGKIVPHASALPRERFSKTSETVLVKNVTLIDQQGQAEDVIVNILIKNNILDVVTQDDMAADTADLALDAQQGILLGHLNPGQPPSFLILKDDPRKDVEILLDTATYASFAMKKGEIIRNRLPKAIDRDQKPMRSGWLAYTPPPLALPMSYKDTTKWNSWDTRYISGLFTSALALDRQYWNSQDGASESQVGDLNDFNGGEIRAFRFGAIGTLNFPQPWVYTLFLATLAFDKGFDSEKDDSLILYDLRLDIPFFAGTTLSIGKQKEPIVQERIISQIFWPIQERSAIGDAMFPSRNVGIVLSGTGFDQRMTWAGGVFNDWLDSGGSLNDNATQYVSRLTWLPWISQDESNLVHLGLGLRYTDAKEGLQYRTDPEFNSAPDFVDTGTMEADSSMSYVLEASWRKGPFWLMGEYMYNDVDAPRHGNPDFSGYYLTGTWALTGEMRGYFRKSGIFSRLPVARSAYQGGWGAWEVAARWSELDLTDGLVEGGEMQILSMGLNWLLSPIFCINFNYRWITLDRFGVDGDSGGFVTRVLLLLE